ncbi:MAG TPA: PKD domain-containing protein [Panacibacter sp.]|nr:PKD domain-containing protein [Panacibacter sp.]
MQYLKHALLFFSLFNILSSFAQKAGFTATIGVNTYTVKNGDVLHVCKNGTVTYKNTASNYSSINWSFDTGKVFTTTAINPAPVLYPTESSAFKTTQTVYFSNGSNASITITVVVKESNPLPAAKFDYTPNTIECGSDSIKFDGKTSSGNGLSYLWTFNGNTIGTGNPIYHAYTTAINSNGNSDFYPYLTVTDNNGCYNQSPSQKVTVKNIPDANLINDPANSEFVIYNGYPTFRHCVTLPSYTFIFKNNSSTYDVDTSYTIDWGDGTGARTLKASWKKGDTIQHIFNTGNTIITLTVESSSGCSATQKFNVYLGSTPGGGLVRPSNTDYCEGATVKFAVSGVSENPPGTVYVFSVNDGSPEQVFYNAIESITHTFNSTSCGTSTDGYQNAFTATLWIKNACDSVPSPAPRIHVTGKPKAKISADSVACINSIFTITNISETGDVVANDGTCSNPSIVAWSVQPSSGFTIVNGTATGSVNGNSENWQQWTAGTNNLSLKFFQANNYKIKFYLSNKSTCTNFIDSIEINVCVRDAPIANIQFSATESCDTSIVKFNATPQSSCAGNNYIWSVVPSDSLNCSASATYSFLQGTSDKTDTAIIKFTGAGKYNITLSAAAKAAATCPVAKATGTVTVKASPSVSLKSIQSICVNDSIAPSIEKVTDCYSGDLLKYGWKFTGGSPDTLDIKNPGYITYNSTGTKTVKLSVTNSCGTTTATTTFDVIANPVADAGSDTVICSGDKKSIGRNKENYIYDWSPHTGLSAYDIAQPFITHINNSTTNDTLIYHLTVSGGINCKDSDIVTVVVRPSPIVSVDHPKETLCKGNGIIITASGAETYTWSPDLYLNTSSGNIVTASPPASQTYTVKGSLGNGCSSTATSVITVVDKPVAKAGGDMVTCSGVAVNIGANTEGYSYQWYPTKGLNDSTVAMPSVTLYNANNKNDTLTYYLTATVNQCSSTDTVQVVVKKSPALLLTPKNAAVCTGNSVTLLANGADSYSWNPPAYLDNTNAATVVSKPAFTTVYTVTGTLLNGCSADSTVTVTVRENAKAVFSPTGGYSDCAGYNLNEVIKVTGYPDRNAAYNWYKNGVLYYTANSPTALDYKMNTAGESDTIQLIATSLYGCKADTTATVIFTTGDSIQAAFKVSDTTGCEPLRLLFNNKSSILNSSVDFSWNFGNGQTSNSIQPDVITFNSGSSSRDTTYKVKLLAKNKCSTDSAFANIKVLPLPVARFGTSDSTLGCSPYTIKFDNTSAGNPLTYYWDFGDGYSFTSTKDTSVTHLYSSSILDTFIVKLAAANGCGTDTLPLPIVIAPNSIKAQVSTYGNTLEGCAPFTVKFVNNTTGAIISNWNYGDGTGEQLPGNIVNVSHQYNDTGTFHVLINFDNGCSKSSVQKQVIVYPPAEAAFNLTEDTTGIICFGKTVFINITKQTGNINRLYWGDNSLFYSPPLASHDYAATGTYNVQLIADRVNSFGTVCSDTASKLIKIAERPKITVSKDHDIDCIYGYTQLNASGGANYRWVPDTTLNNAYIHNPVATPKASKFYTVFVTASSGCTLHDSVYVKADFSNADNGFFMPTAFTPNADRLNDTFRIKYWGVVPTFDFKVFDRRGFIIFQTTDPAKGWDGTYKGEPQQSGTYVYQIRATTNCGKVYKKGTVILIR